MNVRRVGQAGTTGPDAASRSRPQRPQKTADRVEISQQAAAVAQVAALARKVLQMSEVRPEVVREARRLVESGEIFSDSMARQTARAMLRQLHS